MSIVHGTILLLWTWILVSLAGLSALEDTDCGKTSNPPTDSNTKIIGGQAAKDGMFPWLVAIMNGQSHSQFCGGSIINSQHIMTAAHCFSAPKGISPKVAHAYYERNTVVIVGLLDLGDLNSETTADHMYYVESITYHWDGFTNDLDKDRGFRNDIAVIKLKTPITGTLHRSICLPQNSLESYVSTMEAAGQKDACFVAGWGITQQFNEPSLTLEQNILGQFSKDDPKPAGPSSALRYIKQDIISRTDCRAQHSVEEIHDTDVCALNKNRRQSGCRGDSGGGLYCRDLNGRWVVRGIVSWSKLKCARPDRADVYTNVYSYLDFIKLNTKMASSDAPDPSSLSNSFVLYNPDNRVCVSVQSSNQLATAIGLGFTVITANCERKEPSQQWYWSSNRLVNRRTRKCLDIVGKRVAGALVVESECAAAVNLQEWFHEGLKPIRPFSKDSTVCLCGSSGLGKQLVLCDCTDATGKQASGTEWDQVVPDESS